MSRRLAVLFALVLGLFVVEPAYAEPAVGFLGGLQDFAGTREVEEVRPEQEFNEEYEPHLIVEEGNEQVRAGDEEPINMMQKIRSVIAGLRQNFNGNVCYPSTNYYILIRTLLVYVVPFALVFVFFWWGLRKALRMVMASFRKGRMTT